MSCPDAARWSELADPSRSDELERHLDVCRGCCELVAALARAGEASDDDARIGRYVVGGPIGAGGMGVVLEAHDPLLDRTVALKLVRAIDSHSDTATAARTRLLDEARAMARLAHPNVVTIHEVVAEGDELFIAMERIDGPDLTGWLADAPRSPRERLRVLIDAGRGIAAAHAAGLVHRDVKPANILIGRDGRVRITDLGLAAAIAELPGSAPRLVGTPGYIAPEVASGGRADERADQYAFAVTARGLLDDRGRVARVLARARSARPEDRYASFDHLLAALERASRSRWPRIGIAALAIVAVVAIGFGAALWRDRGTDDAPCTDPTLGGAWTPPHRAALLASLAGRDRSPGLALAQRAVQLVDARVAQWSEAAGDACTARVRGTALSDARVACLEAQRHELATAIDGLAIATPADAALRAIAQLPVADACDAPPPPRASDRDPQHVAAMTELTAVWALRASAQYADAGRRLDALAARVPAGDPSLAAAVALARGDVAMRRGDATAALPILHDAIALAERAHDDEVRLRAMLVLLQALEDLGHTNERAQLVSLAEALAASFTPPIADRVSLDAALAAVASDAGDYPTAERRDRAALTGLDREYAGGPAPEIAGMLDNLASALHAEGKLVEARDASRRALAMFEHTVGPAHPDVAFPLTELGTMALEDGDLDEAARMFERVVAVRTAALGADHPYVAEPLGYLGRIELARGHADRALELHRRALAIAERGFGARHPLVAAEQLWLAEILEQRGQVIEAKALCEASVRAWEATGTVAPEAFDARFLLARLAWSGDHARAIALAEAARAGYAGLAAPYRDSAPEIATWLASHR